MSRKYLKTYIKGEILKNIIACFQETKTAQHCVVGGMEKCVVMRWANDDL